MCRWRGCLWACESKTRVHEVTSHQLFDFPSFPEKQLEEQCRETTNHRQWKCQEKQRKWLLVADWIIAVVWDWRQGKYANDCAMFGAHTSHLLDTSTHPSPSALHNSRNTLKRKKNRSESDRKGMQDKYCVCILPPLFFPIVFNTDRWTMKVFWTFAACYLLVMSSRPCCLSPSHCGSDWFMRCHVFMCSSGKTLVSEILFWTHRLRNDWLSSSLIIKVGLKVQNLKRVIILKRQPNACRA